MVPADGSRYAGCANGRCGGCERGGGEGGDEDDATPIEADASRVEQLQVGASGGFTQRKQKSSATSNVSLSLDYKRVETAAVLIQPRLDIRHCPFSRCLSEKSAPIGQKTRKA